MPIWNVMKIKYPNGATVLRMYSEPIGSDLPSKPRKHKTGGVTKADLAKCKTKEERDALELKSLQNLEHKNLKPYTEQIRTLRLMRDFGMALTEEQEQLLQIETDKNLRSSINHTKKKIIELARCSKWTYFVTFTIAPNRDRYDWEKNSKRIREWFHVLRRTNESLSYLIVPEYHKKESDGRAAIHYHALVGHAPAMEIVDSGHKDYNGHVIYNLPEWEFGWTTAVKIGSDIESQIRISRYISKYIGKQLVGIVGKHRYYASKNLGKPVVIKGLVHGSDDAEKLVEQVCEEEGKTVVYKNQHKGKYIDVDYIELG